MIYKKEIKALVTSGPSKMDLITSFAYAHDKTRGAFPVTFYLLDEETKKPLRPSLCNRKPNAADPKGTPMEVKITSITHEDSSGESFLIEGQINYYMITKGNKLTESFQGYYSTQRRKGNITIAIYSADDKKATQG